MLLLFRMIPCHLSVSHFVHDGEVKVRWLVLVEGPLFDVLVDQLEALAELVILVFVDSVDDLVDTFGDLLGFDPLDLGKKGFLPF